MKYFNVNFNNLYNLRNVKKELKIFVNNSEKSLKSLSPVDTEEFKNSWNTEFKNNSAIISNNKEYARSLELGSKPGAKPWPNPGEKTKMFQGKIYSSQALGGIIDKAITEEDVDNLLESFDKIITKSFN